MLFGLVTAFFWGIADFFIKLLGDRLSLRGSLVWTQGGSALVVLVAILLSGRLPLADVDMRHLPLLGAGAAANALGLGLLYAAFRRGRVAVVAPIVGSYAIIATGISIVTGTETVSTLLLAVLIVISAGALMVMLESGGESGLQPRAGALAAAGSALASGFAIWLAATRVLPHVPVADVLMANFALLALAALLLPVGGAVRLPDTPATWAIVAGVILGCVAGYGVYNVGLARGGIAVVSILATLSSAVTILCAGVTLGERVRGVQRIGLGVVLLGLPLLAAIREFGG